MTRNVSNKSVLGKMFKWHTFLLYILFCLKKHINIFIASNVFKELTYSNVHEMFQNDNAPYERADVVRAEI